MYKLTRPDGTDFHSGSINYAKNIGKIIRVTDFDPPEIGECGKGLHSCKNPNNCFINATIPCRAFKVKTIDVIIHGEKKTRSQALKIIEEVTDLNNLFGWNYTEAINPINSLNLSAPQISEEHIKLLEQWASVWDSVRALVGDSVWDPVTASVWAPVWASVGDSVWASVGDSVRASVGDSVWASVGDSVRDSVWDSVRDSVRASVGDSVWDSVRASVGDSVWAYIGSLFNINEWKYITHKKGIYPYKSCVDLWKQGFIPSFDGKIWRLHAGIEATIVWKGKI